MREFIPPLPAPAGRWNEMSYAPDQMDDYARDAALLVLDAVCALLPAEPVYLDPPDGGSVSVLEQLARMAEDAAKWRALANQPAPTVPAGDALRGAPCEFRQDGQWLAARFVALDLVGGEPIVQRDEAMPVFATWGSVRGITRDQAALAHQPAQEQADEKRFTQADMERFGRHMRDAALERIAAQQEPVAADPVVEANRKLLLSRSRVGVEKYGVTLEGANLAAPALVQHALEEALDLSNYLQALLRKLA